MSDRIPKEIARSSKSSDAVGARILVAGASVAAGIGLVGAMAATADTGQAPTTATQAPPTQRIIVIQQPATSRSVAPLPAPGASSTPAPEAPKVVIVKTQPAPQPVTVSEGS